MSSLAHNPEDADSEGRRAELNSLRRCLIYCDVMASDGDELILAALSKQLRENVLQLQLKQLLLHNDDALATAYTRHAATVLEELSCASLRAEVLQLLCCDATVRATLTERVSASGTPQLQLATVALLSRLLASGEVLVLRALVLNSLPADATAPEPSASLSRPPPPPPGEEEACDAFLAGQPQPQPQPQLQEQGQSAHEALVMLVEEGGQLPPGCTLAERDGQESPYAMDAWSARSLLLAKGWASEPLHLPKQEQDPSSPLPKAGSAGPLLSALLLQLRLMMRSTAELNYALTGALYAVACVPQPELARFVFATRAAAGPSLLATLSEVLAEARMLSENYEYGEGDAVLAAGEGSSFEERMRGVRAALLGEDDHDHHHQQQPRPGARASPGAAAGGITGMWSSFATAASGDSPAKAAAAAAARAGQLAFGSPVRSAGGGGNPGWTPKPYKAGLGGQDEGIVSIVILVEFIKQLLSVLKAAEDEASRAAHTALLAKLTRERKEGLEAGAGAGLEAGRAPSTAPRPLQGSAAAGLGGSGGGSPSQQQFDEPATPGFVVRLQAEAALTPGLAAASTPRQDEIRTLQQQHEQQTPNSAASTPSSDYGTPMATPGSVAARTPAALGAGEAEVDDADGWDV